METKTPPSWVRSQIGEFPRNGDGPEVNGEYSLKDVLK